MTNIKSLYIIYLKHPKVSTDTRKIEKGDLYFALKGDSFDGNKFAQQAIDKGASYAIIDDKTYASEKTIIVDDVLTTLQHLATYHRNQLNIPVIGITGSNGKTTTKELIKSVLSQQFNVFATYGNLNNHIGVPLSLLSITSKHEIAIIEMGANHQKEIEFLSNIAQPDYGFITNIGKAHLEGFGGEEGVLKGKTELYTYLKENDKKAFINLTDQKLAPFTETLNHIGFGGSDTNVYGKVLQNNPTLSVEITVKDETQQIDTHLVGDYNLGNILAATAIGNHFGLTFDQIAKGISSYEPTDNRSQLLSKGTNKIVMDAYNANPTSMNHAIENLIQSTSKNKVAIVGDMLELGEHTIEEHQKTVDILVQNNVTTFLVGPHFSNTKGHTYQTFAHVNDAKEHLKKHPIEDAMILIKGSRGIKLEEILDVL